MQDLTTLPFSPLPSQTPNFYDLNSSFANTASSATTFPSNCSAYRSLSLPSFAFPPSITPLPFRPPLVHCPRRNDFFTDNALHLSNLTLRRRCSGNFARVSGADFALKVIDIMSSLEHGMVHAFVEYETVEDAERAVAELNDERNWRTGLRARLLHRCMTKHVPVRVGKVGCEGDGNGEEIDPSAIDQPNQKQAEDSSQSPEELELTGEDGFDDREGGSRRGRGRGRGVRARGRGQYQNGSHRNGSHVIGTPPSSHTIHNEQVAATKQPPGPRMPDGTRGFTMGRGKLPTTITMG